MFTRCGYLLGGMLIGILLHHFLMPGGPTVRSTERWLWIENADGYIEDFEPKGNRFVLRCNDASFETQKPTRFHAQMTIEKVRHGHVIDHKGRAWVAESLRGGSQFTPGSKGIIWGNYYWSAEKGMRFEYLGCWYTLNKG